MQVTNEEVASALNFKTRLKRGWRHIANAFNAATGATGIPRRDSINSSYNYNPYQYPSQSDLDVHSDDNNPYAPTSAIKQVYNREAGTGLLSSQASQQIQQRRLSFLDGGNTLPTLITPHHPPPTHLSRAASTSSQSSRAHNKSDPSSRRQSINHLQSNVQSNMQSPRSSLSNELGTSPNVSHPPQFTAPTPIPMLRGNSDTCTLSNSGSTGEYDEHPAVSRSSAASPAASTSTNKRGSIRGFLKGLTLGNRKSSVSSNASTTSTRFNSFSEHKEREKREKEQKERENEMRKVSNSSLSPMSHPYRPEILYASPPPHPPLAERYYDDDVDIDVQLSGHSDSSDEEDGGDRLLSLSHSHSSNLRSSIIAMDDDAVSEDGAESSDPSELNQPTQYWSNRGSGWRHVGVDQVYDLNEDIEGKEKVMGLNSSDGDNTATSTSTSTSIPNVHSGSSASTPHNVSANTANESTTDTASLATFKLHREESPHQPTHEQEHDPQSAQSQPHLHVHTLQHHPHAEAIDSSSSESEEGDTLEITPRRSRNSSFAITSRSPSMSLSPTKLGQSGILAAPPPHSAPNEDFKK